MRAYNAYTCIKSYIITPAIIGDSIPNFDKTKSNEKLKFKEVYSKSNVVKSRIQIIDKTDRMLNTRTEQLALPKTRHLKELKQREAFKNFKLHRKSQVNRIYRKSQLSLYSRLANIPPEEEPKKPQPWDKETNIRIKERLKKLAKPKKDFSGEKPKQPTEGRRKPNIGQNKSNSRRLAKLSTPRKYTENKINKWCLTKALQYYKPSQRILELSKPRKYNTQSQVSSEFEAFTVQPQALYYKATARIKELAVPQRTKSINELEINPFEINPKALKAVITERIEKLAVPKEYFEPNINDNPYEVSKSALKAKASARIKILSQPRKISKS